MEQKQQNLSQFIIKHILVNPQVSYMLNNLTMSTNYMAYMSQLEPNRLCINKFILQNSIPIVQDPFYVKTGDQPVTEMKYMLIKGEWLLVVTQVTEFKIFNENGSKLLFHFNKPLFSKGESSQTDLEDFQMDNYYQGITVVKTKQGEESLVIGTSNSQIYFVEYDKGKENQFQANVGIVFTKTHTEISCLESCHSDNILIAADTVGGLHLFIAFAMKEIGHIKQIDSTTMNSPITSMKVMERKKLDENKSNILICGDYLGRVVIYCLKEFYMLAQINSHLKMVTTVSCIPETNEIISGSEDTFLNIWKLNTDNSIHLSQSYRLADQIIVGTHFYTNESEGCITTATHESNDITVLVLNKKKDQ